jgi:ligand-binding SRPBCC domain-containing protein
LGRSLGNSISNPTFAKPSPLVGILLTTTSYFDYNTYLPFRQISMARIYLETFINAPIERVFDLARSIDLHKLSTKGTKEEAIGGRTTGLIELNETVTWRAKHFGIYQTLTVVLTELERPNLFADTMLKGTFSSMKHTHKFEKTDNVTKMTDIFEFTSPFGFIGRLAETIFLKAYMTKFLVTKNKELKSVAEGNKWNELIGAK